MGSAKATEEGAGYPLAEGVNRKISSKSFNGDSKPKSAGVINPSLDFFFRIFLSFIFFLVIIIFSFRGCELKKEKREGESEI